MKLVCAILFELLFPVVWSAMSYCSSVRNSFCSSLIVYRTVLVVHFFVTSAQSKIAVSEFKDTLSKGRTIRKLMGGGGRAKYKKKIRAREN